MSALRRHLYSALLDLLCALIEDGPPDSVYRGARQLKRALEIELQTAS